ncbi:MAG TPA: hypothetical protein VFH61_10475 [Thermoleophilia bacterium]|nr:hypothetical protein [Thermoleophilia bacterium]
MIADFPEALDGMRGPDPREQRRAVIWAGMVAAVREFGVTLAEDDLRIALAPHWAAVDDALEVLWMRAEGE